MQPKNNSILRIAMAAAALAITSLAASAQTTTPVFGAINVTFGETLRVNVANLVDPTSPPDPCNLQLNFVNAAGQTVKTSSITVNNGQVGFANITYFEASQVKPTINIDSPLRQVLRPVITVLPPPCRVAITSEVYETATGRTNQYFPPMFLPAVQTANTAVGQ